MARGEGKAKRKTSADIISDSLIKAIAEQRIAPGTRLIEDELGNAFGVSRTVVRQALTKLASQGFVGVRPRKGWFVIEPSEDEVRHAFAARRMIETMLLRQFMGTATKAQIKSLRAHLHDQHDAVAHGDAPRRTHLLGDYHVRIAEALGNPHLVRMVADLVTRTNLMSMLYQSQQEASHSADEHEDILRAIEAGNADKAVRLMEQHLLNVEAGLKHRKISDPVARLQQTLALPESAETRPEPPGVERAAKRGKVAARSS
ncbi:MAG TPA: GntR family transcriptional regulator [Burkholderiaceae bacterium]|nr:GntR family transcriptional regulator [Burkholderiaceae bacterium]